MRAGTIIPDGNDALQSDLPIIVKLVARTARWVDPETFKALPVWAPHTARGKPLYDATWTRQYSNTRKLTGVTGRKFEGNSAAIKTMVAALDVGIPKPKNWSVCHIWGYDDPTFGKGSAVVQDPRFFSCVANMVWLPTALKGFTDTLPEIKAILRTCSYYLYGWVCEHEAVKAQAEEITEEIKSGRVPPHYPREIWPCPDNPGILPPGTTPFSPRIARQIDKRKARIRADLQNPDLVHYPKAEVQEVLKFWKIDL